MEQTEPDDVVYQVDWDSIGPAIAVNAGDYNTNFVQLNTYINGVLQPQPGEETMPSPVSPTPQGPVAPIEDRTPTSHFAMKLRFTVGEWVCANSKHRPHGSDRYHEAYNNIGHGVPRNLSGELRITDLRRYDDGSNYHNVVRLESNYQYFPGDVTYSQFRYCCGPSVESNIPSRLRHFLRGLWLIMGGMKQSTTIGVESLTTNPHDIQFNAEWTEVKVSITPAGGRWYPCTLSGLKQLSFVFGKQRLLLTANKTEAEVNAFLSHEKVLSVNSGRAANAKSVWDQEIANIKHHQVNMDYSLEGVANEQCRIDTAKSAIDLLSAAGKDFNFLTEYLHERVDNFEYNKRDAASHRRRIENSIKAEANAKSAYESALGGKSCMAALTALIKNKIIGGYGLEPKRLLFLFNEYDMPIKPSKKCPMENGICRCQIIVPGTIHIPKFVVGLTYGSSALQQSIQKYRSDVFAPHFRTDGHYCFGGYEEAVNQALYSMNVSSFLMVFADYIHSFNVHSLLTDTKQFKFTPKKEVEGRYGIFTMNPDEHEEGCEECGGDGCDECRTCENCGNNPCDC